MADDVEIRIDDRIASTIASKLRSIRGEALAADTAIDRLKATLNIGNSAGLLQAANSAHQLRRALNEASGTAYSLYGRTSALSDRTRILAEQQLRAARAAELHSAALRRQEGTARGAATSINQLYGMLGAFIGVRTFVDAANAAQTLENKIRAVTDSSREYSYVLNSLYGMALNNRVAVESLGTAFQRFRNAMQDTSNPDILRFVDTLSKGLVTFGATTGEANSAITQLSQAFNKGKLDGDEFRSVSENFPPLMNALTQAFGVTREEIYKLSRAGKITGQVLLDAFSGIADEIDRKFAKTVPTINQALQVLETRFQIFMANNSTAADILTKAIYFLGENLNVVVPIIASFAAAWLTVQFATIIAGLWGITTAAAPLTAAILAWIAAVFTVTAGLYSLGYIMAYITGQAEAYETWVAGAIVDTIKWGGAIAETAQKALGLADLAPQQQALADAYSNTALTADQLRASVQGIMGGQTTLQLTTAAKEAATAVKSTSTAAAELKEEVKLGAGELTTLSGKASGVYDVQKALAATSGAANDVKSSASFAVKELKSLSGQVTGVYSITTALQSNEQMFVRAANKAKAYAAALSSAASLARKLAIGGIGSGLPAGAPVNTSQFPSFDNIGFATGGSFTVGGKAGRDTNPVSFMATKGEKVSISTKAQQRAANKGGGGDRVINVNFTVNAADADSFRKSQRQIGTDLSRIVGGIE